MGPTGLPYRQYPGETLPLFKNNDPDRLKPKPAYEAHVKVFDLSSEDDLKELNDLMRKIGDRKAYICREEVNFVPERKNYVLYVRWMEGFLVHPARAAAREQSYVR